MHDDLPFLQKRSFILMLVFTFLIIILMSRLAWVQLVQDYSKASAEQRRERFVLDANRGEILDRQGKPITGQVRMRIVIFPSQAKGYIPRELQTFAIRHGISANWLKVRMQTEREPFVLADEEGNPLTVKENELELLQGMEKKGIYVLPVEERYPGNGTAQHVIGVVKENPERLQSLYGELYQYGLLSLYEPVGISGLERSFDRYLRGEPPDTVSVYKDGKGRIFPNWGLRYLKSEDPFFPLSLRTTLDLAVQEKLESAFDRYGIETGSGLVIDVKTGDLLAMVSRPRFDPKRLNPEDVALMNRAITRIAPGSVFKIVVAAAALEEGVVHPRERFLCEGEYGKYGFSCWKEGGHGVLTFQEGFAQSCNLVFAQVAKRLGPGKIQEYAEKLGLTETAAWRGKGPEGEEGFNQLPLEQNGQIFFQPKKADEGALIQTAIGQKDVQVTPLQVARMLMAIVNGGWRGEIRIADQLQYKNGVTFAGFPSHARMEKVLSAGTARALEQMMVAAVEEGTAQLLKSAPVAAGGKTGTAQVSGHRNHQWFAGFFPAEDPRYVVVAVAENQPAGGKNKAQLVVRQMLHSIPIQDQ